MSKSALQHAADFGSMIRAFSVARFGAEATVCVRTVCFLSVHFKVEEFLLVLESMHRYEFVTAL